jgi:hypothetical protein
MWMPLFCVELMAHPVSDVIAKFLQALHPPFPQSFFLDQGIIM